MKTGNKALFFGGVLAPLLCLLGNPLPVLLLGLPCLLLNFIPKRNQGHLGVLCQALAVLLIGCYGKEAVYCWGEEQLWVPLILLVLACRTVQTSGEGKIAPVLFRLLLILLLSILLPGIQDFHWDSLSIDSYNVPWFFAPLFLLPGYLRRGREKTSLLLLPLALLLLLWMQGICAYTDLRCVFLGTVQNISGIGSLTRLDGLASVLLSLSWYLFFCMLLSEAVGQQQDRAWGLGVLAGIVLCLPLTIPWPWLAGGLLLDFIVGTEKKADLKKGQPQN